MFDLRMFFAFLFFPFRNARAIHRLFGRGFAVKRYSFTLAAVAPNCSDVCNGWACTHVLNRGGKRVQSPGDILFTYKQRRT